jgi:hypothetical protein
MSADHPIRLRLQRVTEMPGFRAAVAYGFVRLALAMYAAPRTFPSSWRFAWHGTKTTQPLGVAALYSLASTPTAKVFVHTLIGIGCWVWLFAETLRALGWRNRFAHVVVGFAALASLSAPIAVWDRTLLPESLKFSALAAIAAVWMMLQRRRGDRFAIRVSVAVLAITALVSSILFFFVAVPIAIATTHRVWRRQGLSVLAGIVFVLTVLSIWPSTVASGPVKASAIAERSMNIVGERVLPDPYVRRRLQKSGLPRELDPAVMRPRQYSDDNYFLFRNDQVRTFAQSFPVAAYVGAIVSRPGEFVRVSLTSLDGTLLTKSANVGVDGDEIISRSISNVVWGWSMPFHLLALVIAVAASRSLQRSDRRGPRRFVNGAMWFALTPTVSSIILVWANGSDGENDLLLLMATSRLATLVCLATLAIIWVRSGVAIETDGVRLIRVARGPAVREWFAKFGQVGFVAVLGVALVGIVAGSLFGSSGGPTVQTPAASSSLVRTVEAQLRGRNVVVSSQVRSMLRAVLAPWEKREDLQTSMGNADGTPNVEALTLWARGFPDSSTESFAPHLGAIDELRSRLGLIAPDTGIAPVLYWTLKNEPDLDQDYTNVIGHLTDYWNARPEVRTRFSVEGRVDVLGFLKDANAIHESDPLSAIVPFDFFVVRQAIRELEKPNG